ncbi:MAG: hypothetical protein FD120_2831, partial [Gammaproteobacteria bacterium]
SATSPTSPPSTSASYLQPASEYLTAGGLSTQAAAFAFARHVMTMLEAYQLPAGVAANVARLSGMTLPVPPVCAPVADAPRNTSNRDINTRNAPPEVYNAPGDVQTLQTSAGDVPAGGASDWYNSFESDPRPGAQQPGPPPHAPDVLDEWQVPGAPPFVSPNHPVAHLGRNEPSTSRRRPASMRRRTSKSAAPPPAPTTMPAVEMQPPISRLSGASTRAVLPVVATGLHESSAIQHRDGNEMPIRDFGFGWLHGGPAQSVSPVPPVHLPPFGQSLDQAIQPRPYVQAPRTSGQQPNTFIFKTTSALAVHPATIQASGRQTPTAIEAPSRRLGGPQTP